MYFFVKFLICTIYVRPYLSNMNFLEILINKFYQKIFWLKFGFYHLYYFVKLVNVF